MSRLPRIAITMGDPAGVGPELCCQLLNSPAILEVCVPIVFGNARIVQMAADAMRASLLGNDDRFAEPRGFAGRGNACGV